MPLLSLSLPLAAFFGSSATVTSTFLPSLLQGCLGAFAVCEVETLENFLTDVLVLLDASTSLVKLEICKFSRYGRYSYNMPEMQTSTSLSSSTG
nr:hypothetical protein CFP56_57181 [Quercus suber]